MAKPPNPDSTASTEPARESPPAMPRWVKVFGAIAVVVLVALFVIQHLSGLGGMGVHG